MKKFFLIPLMTLMCSVMAFADNVARIGETEYETLQAALDAVPATGVETTVTLLANVTGTAVDDAGVFTILATQNVVLDLNGKTISVSLTTLADKNQAVLKNNGTLSISGNGTITNTNSNSGHPVRVLMNAVGANMTLANCSIIAQSGTTIVNEGTMVINEGTVVQSIADRADGVTRQGLPIDSRTKDIEHPAYVRINGGNFMTGESFSPVMAMDYGGAIDIYGGTFSSPVFSNYMNYGNEGTLKNELTIYGGSFNKDMSGFMAQPGYACVYNDGMYTISAINDPVEHIVTSESELISAISTVTVFDPVKVIVNSDFAITSSVTLPSGNEMVINSGKTLTIKESGLFINNGLTRNNGTIAISGQGFFSNPLSVEYGVGAQMTLEGFNAEVGEEVTYSISTPMHLQYLAYLVRQEAFEGKTWTINLMNDITFPEGVNFEYIYKVKGVFNGNNHSINNFYMSSVSEEAAMFYYYEGTIQDLTIDAEIHSASGASVIAEELYANSIIKNVTINGSVDGNYPTTAFAQWAIDMNDNDDYIWFVNCTNNANITDGEGGYFAGAFFGSLSGDKGTYGFYNCTNNGNIITNKSGGYAGIISGYGWAAGTIEVIALTNNEDATIFGASNSSTKWKVDGVQYIGIDDKTHDDTYLDADTYTAVWNGTKYVAQPNSTNIDNDGITTTIDWAENTTWTNDDGTTHNIVPSAGDDVTVNNTNEQGVVVTTENAVAKSVTVNTKLTIQDGGKLTIGEGGLTIANGASVTVAKGATLIIGEDGVTNNGGTLVIEATQADGAGVVLVDPAAMANNHPTATVKLIPDAHHENGDNYRYRYIGIPLYLDGADFNRSANLDIYHGGDKDPLDVDTYLKSWNPATGWQNIGAWSDLVPFKGYAISNSSEDNLTYIFKGQLMGNADGAMTFSHGFNMFANSYTAPIDIYSLIEGMDGDNVDLTIYMFEDNVVKSVNLGSFAAYEGDPAFTKIPSMQAFFVHVSNAGGANDEPINYAQSVFTPTPEANGGLYAPARHETPDFNRVRINVTAEDGASDAAYLIESASFTSEFDNGYDAVKYMNNGLNLFATTAHGRQSSNYSNSIEGSFIGVQGNGTYTMSFDKLAGEEYQIRDLQNDAVIAMSEDNTYTFTVNGTNDARFVVEKIAKMPTAINNAADAKMFVCNNTLYVSANDADIQIFAANGQLVLAEKAQATVDLSGLNAGVYTVHVANQSLKFVK